MEKKLDSIIISFFVLITLSVVLVAVFSIYGSLYQNTPKLIEENTDESEVEVLADDSEHTLAISADMGQEYIDNIVFLGESTTYGLKRYGVLSGGVNTNQVWTGALVKDGQVSSSGTLSLSPAIAQAKIYYPDTGEALTISQAINKKEPKYLIITLGLNNGASYYNEKDFKQCYRILLDSIISCNKQTKIILQSLFPVSRNCSIKAYTPSRLNECNNWIYDIAAEYDLKYLNTTECLSDGEGYLLAEFDNGGDGIHLNADGLKAVIRYIRIHGYSYEN